MRAYHDTLGRDIKCWYKMCVNVHCLVVPHAGCLRAHPKSHVLMGSVSASDVISLDEEQLFNAL